MSTLSGGSRFPDPSSLHRDLLRGSLRLTILQCLTPLVYPWTFFPVILVSESPPFVSPLLTQGPPPPLPTLQSVPPHTPVRPSQSPDPVSPWWTLSWWTLSPPPVSFGVPVVTTRLGHTTSHLHSQRHAKSPRDPYPVPVSSPPVTGIHPVDSKGIPGLRH